MGIVSRIVLAAVGLLAVLAGVASAQTYPNRLTKILQGFPPGGNTDIVARILAGEMEKGFGQSIIVEAKPGFASVLAAETIARSDPDGYSLLVLPSALPAVGAFSRNVKLNVVDDFTWISVVTFYPLMIAVRSDSHFQTLKQLLDEARAKPGTVKFGSSGVGSSLHATIELLAHQTKIKFLHVPYRGEALSLTGALTGDTDFVIASTGPVTPQVRSGQFRALAVTSKTRWHEFPEVPTVEESGVPGFEMISWIGLAGPANMPKSIVDRLNAEVRRVLAVPSVKSRLESMGGDPRATTPDEMKALVASQFQTWKRLAVEANLSIN